MCVGGCCWPPPSPDQIEADHRRPHLYSRSQPASRARHDFFDNKYESYNNIEVDDDDLCNPHCGCSSPEPPPPPPPLVGFATAAAEEEATSFMLSFSRRAFPGAGDRRQFQQLDAHSRCTESEFLVTTSERRLPCSSCLSRHEPPQLRLYTSQPTATNGA